MKKLLIVFARSPELGKVKTRLASEIESQKALNVYEELLKYTLTVAQTSNIEFKVYWSDNANHPTDEIQEGKDLGEKMYNAICKELNEAEKVCLIGTDTPFITDKILEKAFNALTQNDIVFGPAKDGGYYLVGLKSTPLKELFLNKTWSHKEVLKEALELCEHTKQSTYLLPPLLDIDTKKDLEEWKKS